MSFGYSDIELFQRSQRNLTCFARERMGPRGIAELSRQYLARQYTKVLTPLRETKRKYADKNQKTSQNRSLENSLVKSS